MDSVDFSKGEGGGGEVQEGGGSGTPTRVFLKGGGPRWVGGWVGLWGGTPPPGDPELLEAPKAPKKIFGLN